MNITEIGSRCSGCGCCAALCPQQCIQMTADAEGFLAPVVDATRCMECGLCLARCPVRAQAERPEGASPAAYAAHSNDSARLADSSSGGMFTELATEILARGGTVFGAILRESDWTAEIVPAHTPEQLAPMRGSKYVQSKISRETYADIRRALEDGKPVLLAACPCQVAAARAFLGRDDENFYTADLICHGVPSPLLFQTYMRALEARHGGKITRYRFRDKRKDWGKRVSYCADGKSKTIRSAFDPYQNNFQRGNTFRESCYQCPFARRERCGDVTLGDYWGILQAHPAFYDERGVSLVLANTPKGEALLKTVLPRVSYLPSDFTRASARNHNLTRPCARPIERDSVYASIRTASPEEYVRTRLQVKNTPGELLRVLLPVPVKNLYTKLSRRRMK